MIVESTVQAGGVALNHAKGPDNGPPLLLLHGVTGWWRTFLPILPGLLPFYTVHALDLRGHGRSARTPGAYAINDYTDDVEAFLAATFESPVAVLAHSMGAHVALQVASRAPDRIAALILEDVPLRLVDGALARQGNQLVFPVWADLLARGLDDEALLAAIAAEAPESDAVQTLVRARTLRLLDPELIAAYMSADAFAGYDPARLVQSLACPTLVLAADPAVFARLEAGAAAAMAAVNPNVTTKTIAGAGHGIHTDRPAEFVTAVTAFLASLPGYS